MKRIVLGVMLSVFALSSALAQETCSSKAAVKEIPDLDPLRTCTMLPSTALMLKGTCGGFTGSTFSPTCFGLRLLIRSGAAPGGQANYA
jgi:hypothetical protein